MAKQPTAATGGTQGRLVRDADVKWNCLLKSAPGRWETADLGPPQDAQPKGTTALSGTIPHDDKAILIYQAKYLLERVNIKKRHQKVRAQLLLELEESLQTHTEPRGQTTAGQPTIVFCSTCLNRYDQMINAITISCALLWDLRHRWKMIVTTFGQDDDAVTLLQQLAAPAIKSGNLITPNGTAGPPRLDA